MKTPKHLYLMQRDCPIDADAAGIMTCENKRLFLRKDNGLVRDVFKQNHMLNLRGPMGIGHCRYPTAGSSTSSEAQPFYTNSPYGVALAHNGNLTNSHELIDQLSNTNFRHVNTDSVSITVESSKEYCAIQSTSG